VFYGYAITNQFQLQWNLDPTGTNSLATNYQVRSPPHDLRRGQPSTLIGSCRT
jgi:hypothetical protein